MNTKEVLKVAKECHQKAEADHVVGQGAGMAREDAHGMDPDHRCLLGDAMKGTGKIQNPANALEYLASPCTPMKRTWRQSLESLDPWKRLRSFRMDRLAEAEASRSSTTRILRTQQKREKR